MAIASFRDVASFDRPIDYFYGQQTRYLNFDENIDTIFNFLYIFLLDYRLLLLYPIVVAYLRKIIEILTYCNVHSLLQQYKHGYIYRCTIDRYFVVL